MGSLRKQRADYVKEWSTLAHRSPSDVYVPRALQPARCRRCGWARGDGSHRGCAEGRWES